MSIGYDSSSIQYATDGSKTAFAFPGLFFDPTDLTVTRTNNTSGVTTTLVAGTDYAVTGTGVDGAGMVTTTAAIAMGSTLMISREVELTQNTQYREGDEFPAATHERALDKLTMICQQLAGNIFNSLRVFSPGKVLSAITSATNTVLGFGADEQPQTFSPKALLTFLNIAAPTTDISQGVAHPTAVFADATVRGSAAPLFPGQLGIQQSTGQIYHGTSTATGAWAAYGGATQSFANAGAVSAAVPDFVSQLGVEREHGAAYVATSLSPVNWELVTAAATIDPGTITQAKLATSARVFQPEAKGLLVQSGTEHKTVIFSVTDIILGDGAGGYKQFSTASGAPPAAVTIDITVPGANGLDAGTVAVSTWYHIWAISDGTYLKGLFSTSQTAPTMPAGYTYKLYLGAVRNALTGGFNSFVQIGSRVHSNPQTALSDQTWSGASPTVASLAGYIPTTAVRVQGNIYSTIKAKDHGVSIAGNASVGKNLAISRGATGLVAFAGYAFSMHFDVVTQGRNVELLSTSNHYSLDVSGWEYNF